MTGYCAAQRVYGALQQPSADLSVSSWLRAGVSDIHQIPKGLRHLLATSLPVRASPGVFGQSHLANLHHFGSNPGNLDAWVYVPTSVEQGAPLVVVLHGCTQTAAGYDYHAGWSALAEKYAFVVLLPEQKRANNPNLCFNWFAPRDARRGRGEALSIAQMIETVHQRHGTSRRRVFVTGLSAGGAMTAVMLATYPEVFAGGAIIAGLPFGTANNVPQALERMRGHELPDQTRLESLVRSASGFAGPWPILSVWHGTRDRTVAPANAKATIEQWRQLHGAGQEPSSIQAAGDHTRRLWLDARGREVIEEYEVSGLDHGTPLSTLDPESDETAGPHMLEAGISSTRRIAHFWGIDRASAAKMATIGRSGQRATPEPRSEMPQSQLHLSSRATADLGSSIEKALRAAGLLH